MTFDCCHFHIRAFGARTVRVAAIAAQLIVVACSEGTAPARPLLAIAAGDGQHALAGTQLPELIVVELRDASQRPLAGVRVTWAAQSSASDVIAPVAMMTDGNGNVSARWQLDAMPGPHSILVTANGGATAHARAFADARPESQVNPLPVPTYDGSGQAVHPDFVRLPSSWSGAPYRLVATPYPGGNATYENPSLYSGSTGSSWVVPNGVQNPLERPQGSDYLSDPDMLYDPDAGELRLYYRRVTSNNEIWMISSSNGVIWSAPMLSLQAPNHMIVSPTVVRRAATEWLMWSVNSGVIGCGASSTTVELRRSTNGVNWSDPETTTLKDADGFPWHIDVEWIPSRSEYWAVYPVKQPGGCTTDRLRLATSRDGVHWTSYPSPLLMKGASDELQNIVYRSTIAYDATADVVSIWYSGAKLDRGSYNWHLAWERTSAAALFARVSAPVTAAQIAVPPQANVPQLTNETAP